ncbi:unnamed protein product [Brassicogethes aeneus]|uniref:Fatty acyl-CoA reductase n=1 Tax=Brassicogethes aeneus TaxID=1431903 RepID=A0A9P0FDM8_BRAAE|nr:unnamed protein product [Brassicogethes aeneus]
MQETDIQKYYNGATVFLTGGTGFLGKILIEKLLRSTEVKMIYILIRDKKGKNVHSRADELFDDVIFEVLKKKTPKFRHKIEPIPGDCSISGLGLTLEDRKKIITNTNMVFHVAATVRFDENLKLAYSVNVNAAKEILDLSRQMKNLKSVMHVSTAYSNCHLKEIDEKFYDYPVNYDDVGVVLEKLTKNEADDITPRILGKWPNTYTFTKALAESLIKKTGNGIPIGIFRPAIVVSTYKEPIPGWIDNMYGPTGIVAGGSSGLLRVMKNDESMLADLVPVDTCVAGLIAAAWDVGTQKTERTVENISIYNYVSSVENPLRWSDFHNINALHGLKYPLTNTFWTSGVKGTKHEKLYTIYTFLFHFLPAIVMDLVAFVTGNKPRLMEMYRKIHKLVDVISYFSLREWTFSNDNTKKLFNKLSEKDKLLFPLSIERVNWYIFFNDYMKGVRKYLLKDPDDTLQVALVKAKRINWIDTILKKVIQGVLVILVWSYVSKIFSY